MQARRYDPIDPITFQQLAQKRKDIYQQLLLLRSQRNALSKAAASHQRKSTSSSTSAQALASNTRERSIQQAQVLKASIKQHEQDLEQVESQLLAQSLMIPNTIHSQVPRGDEPVILQEIHGTSKNDSFEPLDHVTLNQRLGFMDMEQASRIAGSSFYYLQGGGAYLELALIQYAMDKAVKRGYLGILTPDIVRTSLANACGFQPRRGESQQMYNVNTDNTDGLCLTGTAEIPLAGKFLDRIIPQVDLPQRCVGFGHAFRMEAGGRGVETKGLYRVHQFSKVELFAVTTPDQSEDMLEEFKTLQQDIFTELGLTFRILDMPAQELGASAHRKYDMEAWLPGRKKWGEISSTSNCTDYQARRLSIRYRPTHPTSDNTLFCHTLNGTAMAVPRVIIAILETFQQPDGSVTIPEVLRKWIPGQPTHLTPS
ncbi:seryl-tRNA synthetase [Halteromyces radiatus]|uniref:seryl-tRNA synthetase n=1 Tax=Halteromyces radiatus TaxID=101107 RepID=UPI00221FAA23|nr:seryl-tRNA synthetase [Halteromyces radiatus]KAI8081786.1 seryl-tRNA synthetase [Halteromyces radiatus]